MRNVARNQPRPRALPIYRKFLPSPGEAVGLVLLALPLGVTFFILDSARWISGTPPLIAEVLLAIVVGHAIVTRVSARKASHSLGLFIGLALGLAQGILFLGDTSKMVMGVTLLTVPWWTAYASVWTAYRGRRPVLAFTPSLLVLVVGMGFLPTHYYGLLLLYLVAAAPALAYFHYRWWSVTVRPSLAQFVVLGGGVVAMALAAGAAWLVPTPEAPVRPAVFKRLEAPLFAVLQPIGDLLASVPNRKDWPEFKLATEIPFTGAGDLNDDMVMVVTSPTPHKWRVRVFETYTPSGWTRSLDQDRAPHTIDVPEAAPGGAEHRATVTIKVRTAAIMDLMASAGEPLAADTPGRLNLSLTPRFTFDLTDRQSSYLPPAIEEVRDEVVEEFLVDQATPPGDALEAGGLRVVGEPVWEEVESFSVQRVEPGPVPPLAIEFNRKRAPPRTYQTTGSISIATPEALRSATGEYPSWVTDRYLQLPPDFPEKIKDFARLLAAEHEAPYDIAQSIEDYLRTLPYSTQIVPPPPGVDGVEWFLTVQQVGFCQYYASAMITMLRSLGIPARLVTGFAPGEWDSQRNAWVVRAKHYHAWPEVYFPEYGWVEFEPTPSNVQPGLLHLDQPLEAIFGEEPIVESRVGCDDQPDPDFCEEPAFGLPPDLETDASGLEDGLLTAGEGSSKGRSNVGIAPYVLAAIAGLTVLAAMGVLIVRSVWRFLLPRSYAVGVFNFMRFLARLAGTRRRRHETPREFGRRLAARLPYQADRIARIAQAYTFVCYGRSKQLNAEQLTELRAAWKGVRFALVGLILHRLRPRWPFRAARRRRAFGAS